MLSCSERNYEHEGGNRGVETLAGGDRIPFLGLDWSQISWVHRKGKATQLIFKIFQFCLYAVFFASVLFCYCSDLEDWVLAPSLLSLDLGVSGRESKSYRTFWKTLLWQKQVIRLMHCIISFDRFPVSLSCTIAPRSVITAQGSRVERRWFNQPRKIWSR